jgi:CrcB protein
LDLIWVGIGGFVGANARYVMGRAIHDRVDTGFPVGTLTINVVGSIAIGILVTLLAERYAPNHALRLLIVTGFLGGYTTFSSYAYEAIMLADRGQMGRAWLYTLGSNGLALAGCAAGVAIVRWLR